MITKFQIEHWDLNFDAKVFRNQLSGHAQTFPPGYRKLEDIFYRLPGSSAQKEQFENKTCLTSQPMDFEYVLFE